MSAIDSLVGVLRRAISGAASIGSGRQSNVQQLQESRYAASLNKKQYAKYEMEKAVAADRADKANRNLAKGLIGLAVAGRGTSKVIAIANASMGSIVGAFAGVINAMMRPLDGMRAAVDPIANLVAKFDPQTVELMERAFSDAAAVMGRMLIPVVQGVTIWIEKFGDVLDSISPIMQPAMDAVGQMIASGAQGFAEMAMAAEPLIRLLAIGMTESMRHLSESMAFSAGVFIGALQSISDAIMAVIVALTGFGKDSILKEMGPGLKKGSAKGTAARNIGVSSVEGFASAQFAASMKNIFGKSEGKKPEMFLPDIAKSIEEGKKLVEDIKNNVILVVTGVESVVKDVTATVERLTTISGIAGAIKMVCDKIVTTVVGILGKIGIT